MSTLTITPLMQLAAEGESIYKFPTQYQDYKVKPQGRKKYIKLDITKTIMRQIIKVGHCC
jgi:hypothetical protein